MLWFKPKCPIESDHKEWLEDSMLWLHRNFRSTTFCRLETIIPTDEFFPQKYRGTKKCAVDLLHVVSGMMDIPIDSVRLEIYSERDKSLAEDLPYYSYKGKGSAGHFHPQKRAGQYVVGVEEGQLKNPFSLVATLSHELGHVLLLGSGLLDATEEDHEFMTDLLTVYYGLGIFTANSAFQFRQWQSAGRTGWSASRVGYLSESMYGYALALYARMRGESDPTWTEFLAKNVKASFNRSQKYITKTGDCQVNELCRVCDQANPVSVN